MNTNIEFLAAEEVVVKRKSISKGLADKVMHILVVLFYLVFASYQYYKIRIRSERFIRLCFVFMLEKFILLLLST